MADEQEDPLLKALMDAGLYGQRMQPLQQRYQLGQQFMETPGARGAQVGGTYVASSPLEHAANALRQFMGARMMQKAQQGQQDLTGQLGAGRQAYAQALRTAGGQPPPGTPEMLGRPADPQETNRLAMLGSLSGDPAMQHAAQMAMQERHLGIQESQMADMMRHRQILEGQGQQKIGLTAIEQGSATDAFGNPITYRKHALPGAVGAAGAAGQRAAGPSAQAKEMLAKMGLQTGQVPRLGMGKAGTASSIQIANRMAEIGGQDADLAGNKAGYKADTASLSKMQTQADALDAFENTALKNLDQFLQTAHSVVDTGSPLFNAPARKFQEAVAGDPKMTQFHTARQVAVQEISRVLGGSMGSVVSDSARHEASALLKPDASLAQIEAAATILKQDMANRKAAMQQQLGAVRGRAGGKAPAPQAEAATPAAAPAAQPHPQDSAALQWAKAHPNDPRAAKILQVNGAQ